MKKYIFTETQIKKIIDSQLNEQYGDTDSPEDMHYVQMALNKYFKAKNIRGVWDGTYDFKLNPKAPVIVIVAITPAIKYFFAVLDNIFFVYFSCIYKYK